MGTTLTAPVDRAAAAQTNAVLASVLGVAAGAAGAAVGVPGLGQAASSAFGSGLTGQESEAELLQYQRQMQQESFFYSTSSAIQSAEHEARMAVVRQLKV